MTSLPGWPADRCLGDRIADLADGRMAPAEAEDAFAHVAICDRCRLALDASRSATAALIGLGDAEPAPSADLLARLRGIPDAESRDRETFAPVVPAQAGTRPSGAAGVRPQAAPAPSRPARRRRARIAAGSAAGAAALVVAAVVGGAPSALGGGQPAQPSIAPVVDALTDEHTVTTERLPFSGPRIVTAAFASAGSGASAAP